MRGWIAFASLALSSTIAAAEPGTAMPSGPIKMTSAEIAKYDAGLATTDPHYIKCVRSTPIGSNIPRKQCRTVEDWNKVAESASQDARDLADRMQTSGSSHGEEPPNSVIPEIGNSPNRDK